MRLWSIHPRYLDAAGLVALWREGLLAQRALDSPGAGYSRHPQLERFKAASDPLGAVGAYLEAVLAEARERGYRFDAARIRRPGTAAAPIAVGQGQLAYEAALLASKLAARGTRGRVPLPSGGAPEPHPSVLPVPGGIATWERPKRGGSLEEPFARALCSTPPATTGATRWSSPTSSSCATPPSSSTGASAARPTSSPRGSPRARPPRTSR